jgi:hypothetical protein
MAMAPLPFDGDGAVLRWSFGTEQALSYVVNALGLLDCYVSYYIRVDTDTLLFKEID